MILIDHFFHNNFSYLLYFIKFFILKNKAFIFCANIITLSISNKRTRMIVSAYKTHLINNRYILKCTRLMVYSYYNALINSCQYGKVYKVC